MGTRIVNDSLGTVLNKKFKELKALNPREQESVRKAESKKKRKLCHWLAVSRIFTLYICRHSSAVFSVKRL